MGMCKLFRVCSVRASRCRRVGPSNCFRGLGPTCVSSLSEHHGDVPLVECHGRLCALAPVGVAPLEELAASAALASSAWLEASAACGAVLVCSMNGRSRLVNSAGTTSLVDGDAPSALSASRYCRLIV